MTFPRPLALLSLAIACVILAAAAMAAPIPSLTGASMTTLQRGADNKITLSGANLFGVTRIELSGDGARISIDPVDKSTPDKLAITVKVAPEAALGDRELRVFTADGVSNLLRFSILPLPIFNEVEPNNRPDSASIPAFPAIISGRIDPLDTDLYAFEAKKDEFFVFDVRAQRIGSALEPSVRVVDVDGRMMARDEHALGFDTTLLFRAPRDGRFFLQIRDMQYRGGADRFYQIHAGRLPWITALYPAGAKRGEKPVIQLIGENLPQKELTLDLSKLSPDATQFPVSLNTPLGQTNIRNLEISDLAEILEAEPNNDQASANVITGPSIINGRMDVSRDVDIYKFTSPTKQTLVIELMAQRLGTRMDGLLTVMGEGGRVIAVNDDVVGVDARIQLQAEKDATYWVKVQDLAEGGSPSNIYRLSIANPPAPNPRFSLAFAPDLSRLHRGSQIPIWVELTRRGGFTGDVAITMPNLPKGVSLEPVTFAANAPATQLFLLKAARDAELGYFPLSLSGQTRLGDKMMNFTAVAESGGRAASSSYLILRDKAPLTIRPIDPNENRPDSDIDQRIADLEKTLAAQTPELAAAQEKWEAATLAAPHWIPVKVTAADSSLPTVKLAARPDGAIRASAAGHKVTYSIQATTDLANITAIQLEALPDPSLPKGGPGLNADGNFVLTRFTATTGDPAKPTPLAISSASADFSQTNFSPAATLNKELDRPKGWAIYPQMGKRHAAVYILAKPLAGGPGTKLQFALDHFFTTTNFNLGLFRLSVINDPKPGKMPTLQPELLAALNVPREKRTPQQAQLLQTYHRSIAPELAEARKKLEDLKKFDDPAFLVQRLGKQLTAPDPSLDAAQAKWEEQWNKGDQWLTLPFKEMTSTGGVRFTQDKQDVVGISANNPARETYTLIADADLVDVTGIRLEALADPKLPGGGPGRAPNGNFVLTNFKVEIGRKDQPGVFAPIALQKPQASFAQDGFPVANVIDGDDAGTGWAIAPNTGKTHVAIFSSSKPFGAPGGYLLRFTLAFKSVHDLHTLGRLRLSLSTGAKPDFNLPTLPVGVRNALAVPAANRKPAQKNAIRDYYRSIAPETKPLRDRIEEARNRIVPYPPVVAREQQTRLNFQIERLDGFAGPVTVSLHGFSIGRDPKTNLPVTIERNLDVPPVTLKPEQSQGLFTIKARKESETGKRMVILKAQAMVNGEPVEIHSDFLPLTIN